MTPPTFRPAEARDAVALAELSGQLGYPSSESDLLDRLKRLQARPDHQVLVATREGVVMGWILVSEVLSLVGPPYAVIAGLVVGEAARGTGLGRQLVAAAAQWATARGLGELRVRTNVVRQEAHGFYRHLGFQPAKTQAVFTLALPTHGPGVQG